MTHQAQLTTTLLDRLWLWGMPVNAIQSWAGHSHWPQSRLNVDGAIRQTGIANIIMAGGLEIDESSLEVMRSARRIICKWQLHTGPYGSFVLQYDAGEARLLATKCLAAKDRRVEGFLLDDFSTGSMDAGVTPEHLARMQYTNATVAPAIPLIGTIYTMSLGRAGLAELLRYFDQIILPLWHVSEIGTYPDSVRRCADLSGGKPMIACLYFYDFGDKRMIDRPQMQRQLDVLEPLLRRKQLAGLLFCGSCMLDVGWESVACLTDWIRAVGNDVVADVDRPEDHRQEDRGSAESHRHLRDARRDLV